MRILIVPDPGRTGHAAAERAAQKIRAVVPCEVSLITSSPSAINAGPAVCREVLLAHGRDAPKRCGLCGLGPCRERV
ncbi:hypothetical protein [Methylobacterium nodulans]|uniref:Uncharacterized protein n=1 Tax=Methylobacterium nodulans (strain LMG 21967 / CNCM I-2342 / ORS 2060) TaxID=460265 RepID=B8IAK0_METNO|nr:hypothetical protein [Methylobacterium nodulans]ACL61045.1 hypothetical protein Mnod_6239 [Methylobacterium nodulans ORS 2060]